MSTKNHNLDETKQQVSQLCEQLDKIESERSSMNEDAESIRSQLEAKGIPRKALQMARAYAKMDPDQRRGFDMAYQIVREALGLPLQDDVEDFLARQKAAEQKQSKDEDEQEDGEISADPSDGDNVTSIH
jgi:uncharacterized protein (UPF0335 family)